MLCLLYMTTGQIHDHLEIVAYAQDEVCQQPNAVIEEWARALSESWWEILTLLLSNFHWFSLFFFFFVTGLPVE